MSPTTKTRYSVNLEEIDSQHGYFFLLLDQFELAIEKDAKSTVSALLQELVRYAKFHFASEESLMSSYEFPGHAHRAAHADLLSRMGAMLIDERLRPGELKIFLCDWIVDHIQHHDVALARFVVQQRRSIHAAVPTQ